MNFQRYLQFLALNAHRVIDDCYVSGDLMALYRACNIHLRSRRQASFCEHRHVDEICINSGGESG